MKITFNIQGVIQLAKLLFRIKKSLTIVILIVVILIALIPFLHKKTKVLLFDTLPLFTTTTKYFSFL